MGFDVAAIRCIRRFRRICMIHLTIICRWASVSTDMTMCLNSTKRDLYRVFSYIYTNFTNLSIITILAAISYFYLALMFLGEPTDLKNMRHGHVKVMPQHLTSLDETDANSKVKDTLKGAVPPIVHYVWCQKDNFQFQNYLSVLSAYKLLKPTEIIFHYAYEPEMDEFGYYQFHGDLLRDLPNFFMEPLQDKQACNEDIGIASQAVAEMLNEYGGIFIGTNVILSSQSLDYLDKAATIFIPDSSEFSSSGLLFLSRGAFESSKENPLLSLSSSSVIDCHALTEFQETHPCVISKDELFPFEIFTLESPFGNLARSLAYGKTDILKPRLQKELIPNIVHYIWLGNRKFRYDHYLSLLSSLFIQKAETVFVHGDFEPSGQYWAEALKTGRVKFTRRDYPTTVYGNAMKIPSHASDFLRYDILNRFGGIYLDWDVYWTKELSEHQRRHESIACMDWPLNGKFPDVFNMGIFGSVKGGNFSRHMLETYRHYISFDWGYNGIQMPYKVYEQHPETLYIDQHLQVICFRLICHPVWVEGYKRDYNTKQGDVFDWKKDTNAVHTTWPDATEFQDQATLVAATGLFAEIGQNILHQAEL